MSYFFKYGKYLNWLYFYYLLKRNYFWPFSNIKQIRLFFYKFETINMGNCQCTSRPRDLKENEAPAQPIKKKKKQVRIVDTSVNQNQNDRSMIRINLRRKSGIFQDISCPIDNQMMEQIQKQLGQLQIPFLGISGELSSVWKEVKINEKSNWWYTGLWKNEKMHGKGYLYSKQEKILIQGLFINDKIVTTKCRIIFESGSFYIGSVNQYYQADGYGQMHFKNGSKYIGNFIGGLPNGSGKEVNENYEFKGKFENGIKKFGTLNDKVGTYQGQFEDNLKHGIGNVTTRDGRKFQAQYSMNKPVKKLESIQIQRGAKQQKISSVR